MKHRTGIIFAYDLSSFGEKEIKLLSSVAPHVDCVKVGLEAMTAEDIAGKTVAVKVRQHFPKPTMWDGKFNDIENTVASALRNVMEHRDKIAMVTLHAAISDKGLVQAGNICGEARVLPLAVTVLTDLDEEQCVSRFGDTPENTVLRFAQNAKKNGVCGLVCSPKELSFLRTKGALERITTVIPGIRPAGAAMGDQKRVMTPTEAAQAGADFIVVGRPIKDASDPGAAAAAIRQELDEAANSL